MRGILLLAVGVLALAACSGGGHSSSHKVSGSVSAESGKCASATQGWVRADLRPVTQPRLSGCDVLLYDGAHGLRVVALDAATGRTVWQSASSTASVTPGVSPTLAIADGVVVVFTDGTSAGTASLVGLDARTGAIRWRGDAGAFSGWPALCADSDSVVCVTNQDPTSGQTEVLRYSVSNGQQLPSPIVSNVGGRDLGPGLFDTGNRQPESLAAVSGGTVAWQHDLTSVFPKPGLSSDNGWNFDRVPTSGLFVGSVAGTPISQTTESVVIDLTRTMTSGFTIATGSPVWSDTGSQYVCSVLPCPGTTDRNATAYLPPTLGLRLRGSGTVRYTIATRKATFAPGASVALEGFDLASGKTDWSVDTGQDLALIQETTPPRLGSLTVVLPGTNGAPGIVDLATGRRSALRPGATYWCQTETTYKSGPYKASNGTTLTDYTGENALFACDARGSRSPTPSSVPNFVGPHPANLTIWSDTNRVMATPTASG